jgi:hypothetical protein
MKRVAIFAAACVVGALTTSAIYAGSPDNPGGLGKAVNDAKEAWQDDAGNKNGWGQAIKANNEAGSPSLGQQMQSVKDAIGASPNPDNDNGGGND